MPNIALNYKFPRYYMLRNASTLHVIHYFNSKSTNLKAIAAILVRGGVFELNKQKYF